MILLVLIALVARAGTAGAATAAGAADPFELAIRYADLLTGADADAARAVPNAGDADGDADDADADDADADDADADDGDVAAGAAERAAELDDDAGDAAADRDLTDLAGDGEPQAELDDSEPSLAVATDDGLDPPDELGLGSGPGAGPGTGPGALAMLDAELDPGDPIAGADAADAAAPAGAAEIYEQAMRHRRPSRWGRLDVGVAWRSRATEPMHAPANRYSELWLVATWRR